ncbi:septal ring lytic transglycosylase RlpA family protein [Diaphorobacter aerolatus]|uniref:Endolytic peptidoglycan transglycosylase RlpA n=2 Tax=Diaphorobacter aerolatus TaxID=1288495 RepID=A0A7H0GQA0_9BURK|nr:septal ring lytic transglycosylase RlpA family protein [Diaphorobacter aerolatus]
MIGKGLASWYGGQFHGRLTANGERYNRGEMTAAHRTLPFGSKVCVRNISTGKTVFVRINDRGPFAHGRVIDLSQAAAQELGIQGLGLKQVELWKLHKGSDSCPDDLLTASADGSTSNKPVSSRVPLAEVSATQPARSERKPSARAQKSQATTTRKAKKR